MPCCMLILVSKTLTTMSLLENWSWTRANRCFISHQSTTIQNMDNSDCGFLYGFRSIDAIILCIILIWIVLNIGNNFVPPKDWCINAANRLDWITPRNRFKRTIRSRFRRHYHGAIEPLPVTPVVFATNTRQQSPNMWELTWNNERERHIICLNDSPRMWESRMRRSMSVSVAGKRQTHVACCSATNKHTW